MPFDLEQVDRLLTTTRAVRRRLDLERPVERALLLECLELALQAPNGSNTQPWRFLLIGDAERKRAIAELCREASGGIGVRLMEEARKAGDGPTERLYGSAVYLLDNLEKVPWLVIPCYLGKPGHFADSDSMASASLYGSMFPAIWSLQLALRSRGLGSVITTLHLLREAEIAELLGIPEDVTQIALLPVAWTKGDAFRPAERQPVEEVSFVDEWGSAPS
jgi:nitroreductase